MKKVVLSTESEVFLLDNIGKNHIVGIEWEDNDKSFLFERHKEDVICIKLEELMETSISHTSKTTHKTKEIYLEGCLDGTHSGFKEAFVFETFDELYTWLKQ